MADPEPQPERRSLGETGQILVTQRAAREYAAARGGLGDEQARRELTELLIDAKPQPSRNQPPYESWRFRRRSAGVELCASVSREGRLAVIVSVTVQGDRG